MNHFPAIVISPIGDLQEGFLFFLAEEVSRAFGLKTCIETVLPDIEFAFHPGRKQYHSTAILTRLAAELGTDQLKILAVTGLDLFIPILTHVYGEAQIGGPACIVSVHRLQEGLDPEDSCLQYQTRVVKEAIHELGHTFGLKHCPDAGCVMHYCRSFMDVDRKQSGFCRYCRVMLDDALAGLGTNAPSWK